MNCADCIPQLDAYADGELTVTAARAIEEHLAGCAHCRAQLASLRRLLAQTAALPKEIPPSRHLWAEIAARMEPGIECRAGSPDPALAALAAGSGDPELQSEIAARKRSRTTASRWFGSLAIAAAIAVMMTFGERQPPTRSVESAWSVATLAGAPRVNARAIAGDAKFRVGQWLETDADSRAEMSSGAVGRVTVDPNSRLRLTTATATDHRLELQRGALSAFIWAPPRIFFVDTPAATAVDLGCAYTLKVDDDGDGELQVTLGYVALEHAGREAIIPSGAMCLTRRAAGPGTPFAQDASPTLRAALQAFDFGQGGRPALDQILTVVRSDDAVTLWHLLARTEGPQRGRVFDVLARHHAPPAGVTREGIVAGSAKMRSAWAEPLGIGTFGRP